MTDAEIVRLAKAWHLAKLAYAEHLEPRNGGPGWGQRCIELKNERNRLEYELENELQKALAEAVRIEDEGGGDG